MKATERETPDAHFTVDKQNISLWPREPPPKTGSSLVLKKPLTVRVAVICLLLVLVTSIVLQAIFYPWLMGTISDVKTNTQVLEGRVDNISTFGSEIQKNNQGIETAGIQIQILKTSVEKANVQIQNLTRSWEGVDHLNAQIPELKRDFDKASALNAKVRGLQSSLENISNLLKGQSKSLRK
ncbi:C-type lectin domain family 4 member K [Castor canadensis]|uniref:C-type lectin domain family 4 member K n=1 Tax=Castor canadensis TaxID=51338 RepID=A0A8B7W239_CASCN